MFINPKFAIEQGWVTGIKDAEIQVQPNAIDFTIDKLYGITDTNSFIISTDPTTKKELKAMRGNFQLSPVDDRRTGLQFFYLHRHTSFDAMSDVYLDLPEGVAAMTVIRSTFNRNGLFLTSGLYDSGYKGHIGFAIHNMSGEAKIQPGTRVGQVIFVKSENAGLYAGGWNHEKGTHYTDLSPNPRYGIVTPEGK